MSTYTLTFPGGDSWQANLIPAYASSVVPFKWRTIAGTNLNLCDDCTATITPPFAINLGGVSFSSLYVDSNGKLNFLFPESDPLNVSLPNTYEVYSFSGGCILGRPASHSEHGAECVWAVADMAPQRELVIEWRNVSRASGCKDAAATVDFEVVLFEGSNNVLFNYAHMTFGGPPACASGDRGACKTIHHAIALASSGDTIRLAAAYTEHLSTGFQSDDSWVQCSDHDH